MDIEKYLAKPTKSVRKHTNELYEALNILVEQKYVFGHLLELLKEAIEYHDYGKVNKYFQQRVKGVLKSFDDEIELPHNLLSLFFIKKSTENIEDYYKIAYAILNHHQRYDPIKTYKEKSHLLADNLAEFRNFIVNKISVEEINNISKYKTNTEAILLKGFLHKCDYSASGEYIIEYKNNFLIDSLNNKFLPTLRETVVNADWNELQNFCKNNSNENIITVANTGMGKTEAGLLWIGDNKGFFILPLKTAINAIFDRIQNKIIQNENIEERVSLLHSDTTSYYLKESTVEEDKVIEYTNKGKQFSLPLTISTLDQIFNFVYKYNGFELKLATLSYSKIVIDEIQAYSPDLLAYLVYGLEKITEVGGKFAILTATLPPFIKDYLNENIKGIKFEKFTKGKDRHHLKVFEESLNAPFIADFYKEKGGKVLIICNTVKKSQEVFDLLKETYNIENVELLHAKFTKNDRKEKEDNIIAFGDTEYKGNKIWVATSVVEASLDIDFDYLFTELNDLNGFFQRLGRVNRKGEKDAMLSEPNAFLFTEIDRNLLKSPDSKRGFIDQKIYELSKEALRGFDGVLSEDKKVELIDEWLTTDKIKGSSFEKRYDDVKKYIDSLYIGEKSLDDVKKMFRDISSYNVIPKSVYEENKVVIVENRDILNEEFEKNPNLSDEENKENREKFYLKKVKARNNIFDFTVSVGLFDLNPVGKITWKNGEIEMTECNYSKERGFERIRAEKHKEETYDNYI